MDAISRRQIKSQRENMSRSWPPGRSWHMEWISGSERLLRILDIPLWKPCRGANFLWGKVFSMRSAQGSAGDDRCETLIVKHEPCKVKGASGSSGCPTNVD